MEEMKKSALGQTFFISTTDIPCASMEESTPTSSVAHTGSQPGSQDRAFFAGLDTLRFLAAMLVVLAHGEAIRAHRGLPNILNWSIFHNGSLAVSFFFVLSGFLITYLLTDERDRFGTISVRLFYQRRALRILPLYFLLVLLGTIVIPSLLPFLGIRYSIPYDPQGVIMWYVALMPFVVNIHYDVFVIGPLWSIGVEEWYYFLVAPVVKYVAQRIHMVFLAVIIVRLGLLCCVDANLVTGPTAGLVTILSFECMAAGGLAALFVRRQRGTSGWPGFVGPRYAWPLVRYVVYTVLALRILMHFTIADILPVYRTITDSYTGTALLDMALFTTLVVDVTTRSVRGDSSVFRWMERCGEYSYGIYMYHNLVAFALTFGLHSLWQRLPLAWGILLYHGALGFATLAIAIISKKTFEHVFLARQRRPALP